MKFITKEGKKNKKKSKDLLRKNPGDKLWHLIMIAISILILFYVFAIGIACHNLPTNSVGE